jgi:FkbM family methyltransferase
MNNEIFSFDYCGRIISFNISNKNDFIQGQIIKNNNFYEIDLLEEISRLPIGDGAFIDVGANIGNHTVYFSSILKRDVYSFEPIKSCHDELIKNILANGSYEKVKVFNTAIGSKKDVGFMSINKENIGASKFNISGAGDVPIAPLDDYIDDSKKVALIKIDVEGYESEVITGAKKIIDANRPLIIAETQNQVDFIKVSAALKEFDYSPIGLKGATRTVFFIPTEQASDYNSHMWFLIRNDIDISKRVVSSQNNRIFKEVSSLRVEIKDVLEENKESLMELKEGGVVRIKEVKEEISNLKEVMASKELIAEVQEAVIELKDGNTHIERELKEEILKLKEEISTKELISEVQEAVIELKAGNTHIERELKEEILKLKEEISTKELISEVQEAVIELKAGNTHIERELKEEVSKLKEEISTKELMAEMQVSVVEIKEANAGSGSEIKESLSKIKNSIINNEQITVINSSLKLMESNMENLTLREYSRNKKNFKRTLTLEETINSLLEENNRLRNKVDTIYGSVSWKTTSPIRGLFGSKKQTYSQFIKKVDNEYQNEKKVEESKSIFTDIRNNYESNKKFNTSIRNDTTNNSKENRFSTLKGRTVDNSVFVGIAAIPTRVKALKETINSLLPQADKIGVYLNGWETIPDYLINDKIVLVKSQDEADIGDIGKFRWLAEHKGYYFTCDDDIVYSDTHVSGIIEKIKEYKFQAVIGWHGSLILKDFKDYYSPKSRRVLAFGSNRPNDTFVHVLGTGTIGFHTSTINVDIDRFTKPNMADVFFAEIGQEQKIPFIIMKHGAKKMISIEEVQADSINKHSKDNVASTKNTKSFQNELVSRIRWRTFNSTKLNVVMIGRFKTFKKGGIFKSNHQIKESLMELGHSVSVFDSQEDELIKVDLSTDIAIIYPGDPNRPDYKSAELKMNNLRDSGVPILLNMSFNTNEERTKQIVELIKDYNSEKNRASVYLMVFSDVVVSEYLLNEIQEYIVPFPKTIIGDKNQHHEGFDFREGIVLGDASKLVNKDITGVDISLWINACKKLMPHVNLYVFKQYGGKLSLPGVEVVPYMGDDFLEWVSNKKLFICLNENTTFEMTPTEAQSVGVPVIYRPMPQSLSEYVGKSGISVTTPEEFAEMCQWLYNDKFAWESYSKLSKENFKSNQIDNLSIGLETSIRKVISKERSNGQ